MMVKNERMVNLGVSDGTAIMVDSGWLMMVRLILVGFWLADNPQQPAPLPDQGTVDGKH